MSLPPGFLDELRTRMSLTQVVGRKVMWDQRKSNQAKGDMWAPCPFHQEKTASFHVDDRKGFYYCFGCHAKGDAISFVRETENVSFMEAVEILVREAGMTMPARDPRAQEKTDHRTRLAEVMEQAVQFFRLQFKTGGAEAARDYMVRRALSEEALDRWEIGFAPDAWQSLWDHLRGKGIGEDLILGAGLARPSRSGKNPYDVFRNRIMFPIRDARGRAIAFGGRAMDPNESAKYLNTPETDLFDKSRVLFNHGPARTAAGQGAPLIVAEGYMDVIALSEAGFGATVAPLGTAITENQLQMLWRISPEPVIALDGDKAGLGAALRLIDLALPLLEAGKALRFVLLPEGTDPDDLIRAKGSDAMGKLVRAAIPMVDLLWQRETEGKVFDSPERKAMLDKALKERVGQICDPSIREHYDREIRDLRWKLFNPRKQRPRQNWAGRRDAEAAPTAGAKASYLAAAEAGQQDRMREAVILAAVICTPKVLEEFEAGLEGLECADPGHARLRDVCLRYGADGTERLHEEIGAEALENLLGLRHVAINPAVRNPGDVEMARLTLAEELAKLSARRGHEAEVNEAVEDMDGLADEALTWRLSQAAEARNQAARSEAEDKTEYDTGKNGALINRKERDELDALVSNMSYSKRNQ